MSVYFARVGQYVKVGYSKDPIRRTTSITTGKAKHRPSDVERNADVDLIGWFPGDRKVERDTHMALGRKHVFNEWFIDCPEVRDYLRLQDEAVLLHEMSGMAVFRVLAGAPVAESMAAHPLVATDAAVARSFRVSA